MKAFRIIEVNMETESETEGGLYATRETAQMVKAALILTNSSRVTTYVVRETEMNDGEVASC